MSLEEEIQSARKKVAKDGYEMSVGELASLYRDGELIINPAFQRLFRWEDWQKSRFIESLLLGIPIPAIFVYTQRDGKWELVDGLQRLATIFEFMGVLKDASGEPCQPSMLYGTKFLPSLEGMRWENSSEDQHDGFTVSQQISIKRSRIRVEILSQDSDPQAKYELFQRLNTGGSQLSEQEIRTCTTIMINPSIQTWLEQLASNTDFISTFDFSENAEKTQKPLELVVKFVSYLHNPYSEKIDVHEYLDKSIIGIASDQSYSTSNAERIFTDTFKLLSNSIGKNSFKKWDGSAFSGRSLNSAFDPIVYGIASNIDSILKLQNSSQFIDSKIKSIWSDETFLKFSGAGVRGTTRLTQLLPFGMAFFRP